LTKALKGGMKDTQLDFMIYSLLKKVLEKSQIDPKVIEDVCLGNVCLKDLQQQLEERTNSPTG
jgi:acetyl-CoA acyltransferase 1